MMIESDEAVLFGNMQIGILKRCLVNDRLLSIEATRAYEVTSTPLPAPEHCNKQEDAVFVTVIDQGLTPAPIPGFFVVVSTAATFLIACKI